MLRKRLIGCGAAVCLVALFCQAIFSMRDDSPTFDELIAPAVGYAELMTGDFGLVDDHPPLYRIFTALPLLALQPVLPLHHHSWQKRRGGMGDRYSFAHEFFYSSNDDADRLLFWSRMPVVLLSMILGLLVFQWTRELYGASAALLALFLYSFEPNLIAHSRLTTNDLVLTLFVFATSYQFWRHYQTRSLRSLIVAGMLFGFALLSKVSAIMLFPLLSVVAVAVEFSSTPPWAWEKRRLFEAAFACFKTILVVSAVALAVVVLFYRSQWGLFGQAVYNAVSHYEGGHEAFLLGDYSATGWWYYFPVVFFLKTPIPLIVFLMTAFLFWSFQKGKGHYFILIPVGVLLAIAVTGRLNIGIRHILPIYPFLIVLAGSIVTIRFSRPGLFFSCFGCLGLWYLGSTIFIFPSYLAYFNEFVGPKRGYTMLVDSNLDWGQDLKRLKRFMEDRRIDRIYLSYFGTADPCDYGIHYARLPAFPELSGRCDVKDDEGRPDFLAVSVTNLQAVYLPYRSSFEWLKAREPVARIGYSIFVYDIRRDVAARNDLGLLYLKYTMFQEALNEFLEAAALAPTESIVHSNLGFAHALLSKSGQAEAAYRKALELDPGNQLAKERLKALRSG